jgi:hypothetical protein
MQNRAGMSFILVPIRMRSALLVYLIFLPAFFVPVALQAQVINTDSVHQGNTNQAGDPVIELESDSTAGNACAKDTIQHLYRINYWISSAICAVATATDLYAIPYVIKSKKDLTDKELQGLNKSVFSGFDRWALEQDLSKRQSFAKASDYTLPVLIVVPGLLAFDQHIKQDWFRILLMYYEMHSITFSIYNYSFFGPAFQNKYRPIVYYDQLSYDERKGGNYRNSMYSGHTATAIASTFFMVKVYSDYHPEIGRKKYLLYAIAAIPPIVEGYFRVKAVLHFPSDVAVGLAIGAACGIMVPEIHRFKNHKVTLGLSGGPMGPGMNMVWNMD